MLLLCFLQWNNIEDSVKDKLNIASKGDGEFWMPIVDYYTYYSDTHVCNFTPDFDQDGKEDNLGKICIVSAIGSYSENKHNKHLV